MLISCSFIQYILYTWFPPTVLHCIKLMKNIWKEWLLLSVLFVWNQGLSAGVRKKNGGTLPFKVQNKLLRADSSRTGFWMFPTPSSNLLSISASFFTNLSRLHQGSFTLCVWLDSDLICWVNVIGQLGYCYTQNEPNIQAQTSRDWR